MKAYKLEVLVIDHEQRGPEEVKLCIENEKYMTPKVMNITEIDIGDWSDDHPLNKIKTDTSHYINTLIKVDRLIEEL